MNIETMEGRRLFSVTVSEGYPGFYEIFGDEDANVISVSVDMENQTFTLDEVTYTDVAFICVLGGGGDDTISLDGAAGGYIGASVDAGTGDDEITINFDGSIWAGDGDDVLNLSDAFRGEVYGEDGHDLINVSGECINPEINGGHGDDVIDASGNNYGVVIRGGTGDDTVYGSGYDDVIYGGSGADTLFGGGGNDVFEGACGAGDYVDGGDGVDILYADGTEVYVTNIESIVGG